MGGRSPGFSGDTGDGAAECGVRRVSARRGVASAQAARRRFSDRIPGGTYGVYRGLYRNARTALRSGMFSCSAGACRTGFRRKASAVLDGLGMNRQAVDLRETLPDAALQQGGEIVDVGDRQIAIHRAVAGDQNAVFDAANVNFVTIHELMIFRRK